MSNQNKGESLYGNAYNFHKFIVEMVQWYLTFLSILYYCNGSKLIN